MAGGERIERPKPASKTGGLPLAEPPAIGVTGENRTPVVGATIQRLSHSATVTSGAYGSARISVSGFSDRRWSISATQAKVGGEPGVRTPTTWLQAKCAAIITSPPFGCRWSPAPESNWLARVTRAAHRRNARGSLFGAEGRTRTAIWALREPGFAFDFGASGENRTFLASLEGWNSANKSHSLEIS